MSRRAHKAAEVMDIGQAMSIEAAAGGPSDDVPKSKRPRGPRGWRSGEQHGYHVLDQEQVNEIRRLYSEGGITQIDLAEKFNTTPSNINAIIHNSRWVDADYRAPDTTSQSYRFNKLDMDKARQIREMYAQGMHAGAIADRFKIHITSVANVVQNKSWPDPNYVYKPRILSERHSVLTAAKVREIREKLLKGATSLEIAREYGVSKQAIDAIRAGRTWKNV
jgi:DNA invertase Pin-like site-specific DNA recombinase